MRTFTLSATCVAILVVASATVGLRAQGVASPAAGGNIAVIDIGRIFKNHVRFDRMMKELKRDVDAEETQLKKERSTIQQFAEKMQGIKPNHPDYKRLDEDLSRRQAEWQLKMSSKKKTILERETQIYYNVFQEINYEVRNFADRHGISLVLRYNSEPVDTSNPQSVRAEINKSVVYQRNIDITDSVLNELNRRAVAPPNVSARPGVRPLK